jgi:hypothetical protein
MVTQQDGFHKHAALLCRTGCLYNKLIVVFDCKESRNRPGVAQRVPGGLGSQIFMTFST